MNPFEEALFKLNPNKGSLAKLYYQIKDAPMPEWAIKSTDILPAADPQLQLSTGRPQYNFGPSEETEEGMKQAYLMAKEAALLNSAIPRRASSAFAGIAGAGAAALKGEPIGDAYMDWYNRTLAKGNELVEKLQGEPSLLMQAMDKQWFQPAVEELAKQTGDRALAEERVGMIMDMLMMKAPSRATGRSVISPTGVETPIKSKTPSNINKGLLATGAVAAAPLVAPYIEKYGATSPFDDTLLKGLTDEDRMSGVEYLRSLTPEQLIAVGGTVAGERALRGKKQVGEFTDLLDGKVKVPISDVNYTVRVPMVENIQQRLLAPNRNVAVEKVSNIIDHPELFELYPEFKDWEIQFKKNKSSRGYTGLFDPTTKTITVFDSLNIDPLELKKTLAHEWQHGIQDVEKFNPGTNPELVPQRHYENKGGEVESQNVEASLDVNPVGNPFAQDISKVGTLEGRDVRIASNDHYMVDIPQVPGKLAVEKQSDGTWDVWDDDPTNGLIYSTGKKTRAEAMAEAYRNFPMKSEYAPTQYTADTIQQQNPGSTIRFVKIDNPNEITAQQGNRNVVHLKPEEGGVKNLKNTGEWSESPSMMHNWILPVTAATATLFADDDQKKALGLAGTMAALPKSQRIAELQRLLRETPDPVKKREYGQQIKAIQSEGRENLPTPVSTEKPLIDPHGPRFQLKSLNALGQLPANMKLNGPDVIKYLKTRPKHSVSTNGQLLRALQQQWLKST